MKFTFTEKIWKKERPEAAENKGVAKAMNKVLLLSGKEFKEEQEVKEADLALEELTTALGKALQAIKNDGKNKDRNVILTLIGKWEKEIETAHYELKVAAVRLRLLDSLAQYKEKFLKGFVLMKQAAEAFEKSKTLPTQAVLQSWLGQIRDTSKYYSKQFIASLPGGNEVKASDVGTPPDAEKMKLLFKHAIGYCTVLSEGLKNEAENYAPALDENVEIEKTLKAMVEDYKKILKGTEPYVKAAKEHKLACQQMADEIKEGISKKSENTVKPWVEALVKEAGKVAETNQGVIKLHFSYREGGGDLYTRQSNLRKHTSFVENTHSPVISKVSTACQTAFRLVSMPLQDCVFQIDRARRLLEESENMGDYARAIPKIKLTM